MAGTTNDSIFLRGGANGLAPLDQNANIPTMTFQKNVVGPLVASTTLTQAQSGSIIQLGIATGMTVTLPAPVVGTSFSFLVTTAVTSNSYKIITNTGTVLLQGAYVIGYSTLTDCEMFQSVIGSSNISFNMNGSTSGGLVGTLITFDCVSSTLWQVSGTNFGSGTVVTSFANS
jgi:hypothetical protein